MFGKKKTVTVPVPTAEPVAPTSFVNLRKEAAVSLKKHGLEVDGTGGIAVYLVLDHSWSMKPYYADGSVQRITEQVLALSAEIDDDGKVPVFYFGSGVEKAKIVKIGSHDGWVDSTHTSVPWGSTNYVAAIDAVRAYHAKHGGGQPALVVFQTDGSPDNQPATTAKLVSVAGEDMFFAFVGFGPKEYVQYLFTLDEIEGRVRDNASAFHAVKPMHTENADLYDGVLGEFTHDWLPEVLS